MDLYICAIRDSAVEAYLRPIFVNATGQASRSFSDEVNRVAQDNDLNKHPDDFELYLLGTYDDSTGRLDSPATGPTLIIRGKDCVKPNGA